MSKGFWADRPVLVTGATGLLGSWMCSELVERGASVVALIRDHVPHSAFFYRQLDRQVRVVHGELEDYFTLERTLNEYEIETIFHFGAQTIVGAANRSPRATFQANIMGTVNVLEAARQSALVRRVVVASSDKAYGEQATLPYTEEAPLTGRHPYDVSKSCTDLIAQSYFHTYRLPVCIARCGNLYGLGDQNTNRIVPGTIYKYWQGEPPIIRSNGTMTRDYFYVRDAVMAYLTLAAAMDDEQFWGEAFNFGTEQPVSVLDIVQRIGHIMGCEAITPTILGEANNEIPHQWLACDKAHRLLQWSPAYDLDRGLAEAIPMIVQYFEDNRPASSRKN
ncbi:MAG TPA: GDP-mannose 4,6-dehydratase [Armatimonadota bacterium]|nr:GDP-mannose 4,6-dehydratase [Armatimonadota bacterium]